MAEPDDEHAADARTVALRRLGFLRSVGLGYLQLNRTTWTLSAGEAQRIKLASVLGGGLVGMTVLLDEPSRGLHPSEVTALARTLTELRDAGNTVIAVEHDPTLIRAADDVIEIGPGPGRAGGRLVDLDSAESVTRAVLDGRFRDRSPRPPREPTGWMQVTGARENNLRGLDVRIPLGVQVGVCGVSGSGKSSLVVDTIALGAGPTEDQHPRPRRDPRPSPAPTTPSPARPPARSSPTSPAPRSPHRACSSGSSTPSARTFAASEVAVEQGITIKDLTYGCDACNGKGAWQEDMCVPAVGDPDLRRVRRHPATAARSPPSSSGAARLADIEALTIAELVDEWGDVDAVRRVGDAAVALGLGYLIVRQPGWSLSGGEAQRLKLAKELARRSEGDRPVRARRAHRRPPGHRRRRARPRPRRRRRRRQHACSSSSTTRAFLATCDWLIELGPGAGPDGGRIVFEGPPDALAEADTPTAPYLLEVLA